MKFTTREDPRPPPGVVGRQFVIEDPRELRDAVTSRLFGQETVRTAIHDEPALLRRIRHDLRLNLATETPVLLDQNELDVVALGCGPC